MTTQPTRSVPAPGTARRVVPPSKRGRIWVLEGARVGDNAQAHALAHRLSPNYRTKKIAHNRLFSVPNVLLGATLLSVDKADSDDLLAPWPDLVISAGRRSVPVARWIKKQSAGRTKLVQIGRPRAPLDWFDLVVTTPQYGLPENDNVIELPLPIVPEPDPPLDHQQWQARFHHMPRPWIAILVGGDGPDYRFGEAEAHKLAVAASRIAHETGGSILVSTSPRTGRVQSKAIERTIVVPSFVHHWSGPEDNPHHAILALADRFIVTSDSVSMIAEACITQRPVQLCQLPTKGWRPQWQAKSGLASKLAHAGLLSPPRDISRIHRRLVEGQYVSWLGEPVPMHRSLDLAKQEAAISRISRFIARTTTID